MTTERTRPTARPSGRLGGLLLAAAVAACAGRDSAAVEALRRLAASNPVEGRRTPVRGVRDVAIIDGNGVRAHRERVFDDGDRDVAIELVSANGARWEEPLEELLFQSIARYLHRFRDLALESADRVLAGYDVALLGDGETVAGRPTRILRLTPRSATAFVVQVWSDRETGLALAVERRNASGAVVQRMRYAEVEIGNVARRPGDPPTLPLLGTPPVPAPGAASVAEPSSGRALRGFLRAESVDLTVSAGAETTTVRRDRWTDGVESAFVLEGDAESPLWSEAFRSTDPSATTVVTSRVGAVELAMTRSNGRVFAAFGRLPEAEIVQLVLDRSGR